MSTLTKAGGRARERQWKGLVAGRQLSSQLSAVDEELRAAEKRLPLAYCLAAWFFGAILGWAPILGIGMLLASYL